jgi:uncharacterized protein
MAASSSATLQFDPVPVLADELSLPADKVRSAIGLLEEGNTVPFIARYRKEATGGLDDASIHNIEERRAYLQELHDRRQTILKSIEEQGKLSDNLRGKILGCTVKSELEDLYLPYRPKRRTRATIAREKGLGPLAELILAQGAGDPKEAAKAFVSEEMEVADVVTALAGAQDIVAEVMSENADIRAFVRKLWSESGEIVSTVNKKKAEERTKFEQYYDFREPLTKVPSHRFLAIRRGEHEGVLKVQLDADPDKVVPGLHHRMKLQPASGFAEPMRKAIEDGYRRLVAPAIETDLRVELKLRSDRDAVEVFADNLRALLLAAPLGRRSVLGIDPGLRTGCKCAAVDSTGKYLGTTTLYLIRDPVHAQREFLELIAKFKPSSIAIGNGTAGRETESFVRQSLKVAKVADLIVVSVNEAGASVYSASEVARQEFPELDVTVRGAVSIARRLQDPLAELVKIDPKSIGVGQYQHDVHQPLLHKKLDEVVESCVNQVGVELNTASAPLLSRVAGIGPKVARAIVDHRESNGAFEGRKTLLKVAGLGPKTYEQCAGFLRLHGAKNPLDASAVHPERYKLVERMAQDLGTPLADLVGNEQLAGRINLQSYVGEGVGEPTLRDIIDELKKPGRDPRDQFEAPSFREDVQELEDLQEGMILEGAVTNVTAFGAFVDVGVHQDGLVHISELADHYVEDPRQEVKVGDKLSVRVLQVDLERRRIALSAKKGGPREGSARGGERPAKSERNTRGGDRGKKGRGPTPGRRSSGGSRPSAEPNEGRNNPLGNLLKDFLKDS